MTAQRPHAATPRLPALLTLLGMLAMATGTANAQSDTANARLEVQERSPYGRYLSDREGHSLYVFEKDQPGSEVSQCTEACANAWPPFTTRDAPTACEGVDGAKLGTIEREKGIRQVTYAGWPLYYFNGDKQPGDALGQAVMHLGGEWYLLSPAGETITQGNRSEVPDLEEKTQEGEIPASEGQEIHDKIEDNPGQADDA